MSTYAEIVEQAYLAARILALGDTLDSTSQTQGLTILEHLVREACGDGVGYPWIDVVGETGYVAGEDERIVCDTALTITLPDYVTFEGEGTSDAYDEDLHRPPLDMARVQVVSRVDNTNDLHFYRSDRGEWVEATFVAADQFPFSEELDRSFVAMLAEELAGRVGRELAPSYAGQAQKARRMLRARGRRPSTTVEATYY